MDYCPVMKRSKIHQSDEFENQSLTNDEQIQPQLQLHSNDESESYDTIEEDATANMGNIIDYELKNKLRQFDVLDEVQGDDSSSDYEGGDSEYESSDTEFDAEEVERMLDEQLPENLREKRKETQYDEKYKIVLEEKGHNHFDVLPEGWVQVTHNSGMPLYLHKTARVCTAARPYFLGPGSVRKHEIPLNAIPCLNYVRALEKEEKLKNEQQQHQLQGNGNVELNESNNEAVKENGAIIQNGNEVSANDTSADNSSPTELPTDAAINVIISTDGSSSSNTVNENDTTKPFNLLSNAKIETVKENIQAQSLTPDQITAYCKRLFHFKQIRVMRFKSWSARRKFTKNKKQIRNLQRPTLPDGTKLITFPLVNPNNENNTNARQKREWTMNPSGKSFVCILHEYVQYALKKQPSYEFKELETAQTPYSATVTINELKYGTGYGTSKKQAKSEAARVTLEILIPEMHDKISSVKNVNGTRKDACKDLSVFDEIRIEDPRVAEFCAKTTEPSPHAILLTCLQRNFGLGDIKIDYQVNTMKHKKNEFTMTVGKHVATVICKNKRDGKQRASQAILQILHPHIKTWGSLLRLYGNQSVKSFKEKKQEEQEITVLQSKAAINQPNYAILDKLKLEMRRLIEAQESKKPIGTFVPPVGIDLPQGSGSNLNNVEL